MKRRRFLSSIAIILPASIVSTEFIFSSCKSEVKEEYFTEENIKLLDEIGETIIPATYTSPGAKAARIGEFIKVYVTDCYTQDEQDIFWSGVNKIKALCKSKYGKSFLVLNMSQRQIILKEIKNDSQENAKSQNKSIAGSGDALQTGKGQANTINNSGSHFYSMFKYLTLFGFFTSQPGATQALRYVQTPGSYKGNVPYKNGDKAWAT